MMKEYWNQRFLDEGLIWGEQPSETAFHAKEWFKRYNVKSVLVPGAGYGRNTKLLSDEFEVDAIELSSEAVQIARQWDDRSCFIEGSIFDSSVTNKQYDAVYCYDLLHLFTYTDRARLIQRCMEQLGEDGLYYFTCFSDEDAACGTGKEIEPNTFEYKTGKFAHFFSEDDLRNHFEGTNIIETGTVQENFDYSNGSVKTHTLRYIYGHKR